MSVYEYTDGSPEQMLWEDMVSYGCRVLLRPTDGDAPMCYLSPEERDVANTHLVAANLVPAERIGVGFTSSDDGPVSLSSPDLIPYAILLSSDGVVTAYSLLPHDRLGSLVLTKELTVATEETSEVEYPARERLSEPDCLNGIKFLQILHRSDVYHATEDERQTLLHIFAEIV